MRNTAANQEPGKNKQGKGVKRYRGESYVPVWKTPDIVRRNGSRASERIGRTPLSRILIDKSLFELGGGRHLQKCTSPLRPISTCHERHN